MPFHLLDRPLGHVALHLSALTAKVDEVAARAGVSAFDRLALDTALAALPWPERRRLALVLESARVSADSAALQTAVEMILERAADIWDRTPPPDHANGE